MGNTNDNSEKVLNNLENAESLLNQLKNDVSDEKIKSKIDEMSNIIEETSKISLLKEKQLNKDEKSVLIISSKTQKVTLPYTQEDINNYMKSGKYKTKEEVIENEFIIPLDTYKNETFSRIREGYRLARNREKKSVTESIKYSLSLSFERKLHPAVITACKTIDELSIYLACLDENVTELFDYFNVVFEYAPIK